MFVESCGKETSTFAMVVARDKGFAVSLRQADHASTALLHNSWSSLTHSPSQMNTITALQFYIDKMLGDTPGMKVLLLDSETASLFSTAVLVQLSCYPIGSKATSNANEMPQDQRLTGVSCCQFIRLPSSRWWRLSHISCRKRPILWTVSRTIPGTRCDI